MQAALAEFPYTSLVTPTMANLHRFSAVADMKYSTARITITTHSKKSPACSPCTLLILKT